MSRLLMGRSGSKNKPIYPTLQDKFIEQLKRDKPKDYRKALRKMKKHGYSGYRSYDDYLEVWYKKNDYGNNGHFKIYFDKDFTKEIFNKVHSRKIPYYVEDIGKGEYPVYQLEVNEDILSFVSYLDVKEISGGDIEDISKDLYLYKIVYDNCSFVAYPTDKESYYMKEFDSFDDYINFKETIPNSYFEKMGTVIDKEVFGIDKQIETLEKVKENLLEKKKSILSKTT